MSPHHSQPDAAAGGQMEVPQGVIAQAEAAAGNSNQTKDGQRHSEIASERLPEAFNSEESGSHPQAIHQGYA